MPARLNTRHQESVRNLIRANRLVVRLQQFALGRKFQGQPVNMSPSQVRAAEVLLRKLVPDLSAVDHTGEVTHHYVALVPAVSESTEEWQKQHVPPTMQ